MMGARIVWQQYTGRASAPPARLAGIARSLAAVFGGSAVARVSHGRALAAIGVRYARKITRGAIALPNGVGPGRPVALIVIRGRLRSPAILPFSGKRGTVLAVVVDRSTHAILDATLTNAAPRLRASALQPLR
jgi:hypothetical protein